MTLLFCCCLLLVPAEGFRAFYLEGSPPDSSVDFVLSVAGELENDLPHNQLERIKSFYHQGREFSNGDLSSHGKLWFVGANNVVEKADYFMVDRPVFAKFVDARRFGGEVIWNGDSVRLTNRVFGKHKLGDGWGKYHDGIFVWGGPDVHQLSLTNPKEWAEAAKGKHFSCTLDTTQVPASFRDDIYRRFETRFGLAMQRRDGEDGHAYSRRRTTAVVASTLLKMILPDIKTVNAWTRWPQPESTKGFSAGFRVDPKPDSQLEEFLISSKLRTTRMSLEDDEVIGKLELHLGIPPAIRKVIVQNLGTNTSNDILESQFRDVLTTGRLEAITLVPLSESDPKVVFAMPFQGDIAAPVVPRGLADFARLGKGALNDYHATWQSQDGLFRLVVARTPRLPGLQKFVTKKLPRSNRPLMSFNFDLAKWPKRIDPSSPSNGLLNAIEEAYEDWVTDRLRLQRDKMFNSAFLNSASQQGVDPKSIQRVLASRRTSSSRQIGEFKRIHVKALDGDWKGKGSVKVVDGALVGRLTIGRELHRHYRARELLGAARRMENPGER